jgi:DNA-binding beta-propeller fold protein YncE
VLQRRGSRGMTRLGFLLATVMLALLAACGSRQAAKTRHVEDARIAATSTPAPASARPPSPPSPPAPQALVTDETQNRLLVVDLPSGRIARRVRLPADPEDIATSGNGGVAVVVSSSAGKLTVLARDTLRILKSFGGFDQPHIASITPDGGYAYITDDARGTLTAIRLSDMKVISTVLVGTGAHHLAISPDERQVWIGLGERARTIMILSTVVRTPSPPSSPVINAGRPRVIGHLTPGFSAHDLSFSPDGRRVWISSAAGPDVTIFDARTRKAVFRVPAGPAPQHLAFMGHYAYLTSGYGSTIEKVNASTGRVISRASAPYGSFELAAADGYVATASLLRGTLSIYTPNLKLIRTVKLAPATREVAISRA